MKDEIYYEIFPIKIRSSVKVLRICKLFLFVLQTLYHIMSDINMFGITAHKTERVTTDRRIIDISQRYSPANTDIGQSVKTFSCIILNFH